MLSYKSIGWPMIKQFVNIISMPIPHDFRINVKNGAKTTSLTVTGKVWEGHMERLLP